jgi:hypothetical protein
MEMLNRKRLSRRVVLIRVGDETRDRRGCSCPAELRFQNAMEASYDDSAWRLITLPHTWNAHDVTDECRDTGEASAGIANTGAYGVWLRGVDLNYRPLGYEFNTGFVSVRPGSILQ